MKISKLHIFSLLAAILALASCSSDRNSTEELLAHIPAEASDLVLINPEACGLTSPEGSRELARIIEASAGDKATASAIAEIMQGKAGIDLNRVALFRSGTDFYCMGRVEDKDALAAFARKNAGKDFTDKDGVKICGSLAVSGDYFWITANDAISPTTIKDFNSLDKKKSWLANDFASTLAESEAGIEIVADAQEAIGYLLPDGGMEGAALGMALSVVLADINYMAFSASFPKGTVEVKITPLDSRFRPAEYLLPAGKVDASAIAKAGLGGDAVVAVDLPAALMKQLQGILGMIGNAAGGTDFSGPLSAADGTFALALSQGADPALMLRVAEPAKGDAAAKALSALFFEGKEPACRMEGNILILGSTPVGGKNSPNLKPLEGAAFGLAGSGAFTGVKGVSYLSLAFRPEGKSLAGTLTLKMTDPKAAPLPALLAALTEAAQQTVNTDPSFDDDEEPLFDEADLDQLEKMMQ